MAEAEPSITGLYVLVTLAYRWLVRRVFPLGPEKWFVKAARWLLYDGFGLERQKTSPTGLDFRISSRSFLGFDLKGR